MSQTRCEVNAMSRYTCLMLLYALIFGVFGAVIGSFLNVLVLRKGVKGLGGRSGCTSCGHELEAVDLVPIVSYLALRGRCRFCGSKISVQYPLVEAATAILFGFIGAAMLPLPLAFLALPIAALLVAISAYDLRHSIIPDGWVLTFTGLSLLWSLSYLTWLGSLQEFSFYFWAGPALAFPFFALWFLSRGRAMGLGDAKFAWGIGWLLGILYGFFALVYAFVLGAAVSVFILLPLSSPKLRAFLHRVTPMFMPSKAVWGFTIKSEVAFGPFLALACAIVWLLLLYHLNPIAFLDVG